MATLTQTFRADSERIRNEHKVLQHILERLDSALDQLVCYSEVYANLASADHVRHYGRQLTDQFPGHCQREEAALLDTVSQVSPELAEFCGQMKSEHVELLAETARFRAALDAFDTTEDLYESVCHLKDVGKELTRNLRRHVAAEEQELSGFL